MNPALVLVLLTSGSGLFIAGALAWVFGWLPAVTAGVLAVFGAMLEGVAAWMLLRQRAGQPPKR